MLPRWPKKHSDELLGIEASDEGIALARISRGKHGPSLKRCEFISGAAVGSLEAALAERIQALGLSRLPCNWVLNNSHYNLLLVEAPNVPAEELREAMRWRIRDLISYPADQATLDLFPLPEDGSRGKKMLYVVVTEKQNIRETLSLVRQTGMDLKSIDIAEMALRNIAERVSVERSSSGSGRGTAIVRLRQGSGNLVLIRGDRLYLSRHFDLNYNGGLLDDLPEPALILELQRSLDYYERQMGQEPPAQIVFCGDNISQDKLSQHMQDSLPGAIECLDLSHVLPGAEHCDSNVLQLCLGAIGGALRREAA